MPICCIVRKIKTKFNLLTVKIGCRDNYLLKQCSYRIREKKTGGLLGAWRSLILLLFVCIDWLQLWSYDSN